MNTNTASAEISDKFRLEMNGVISYDHDSHGLGYNPKDVSTNKKDPNYWNSYNRLVFTFYADKNVSMHARLHSNYDDVGNQAKNTNTKGAYFDQYYLQFKDKPAHTTYLVGKKGAYLGQGMVYNSSGNLTGLQVSFGDWWGPECLQLIHADRDSGDKITAAQYTKKVSKATELSTTWLMTDSEFSGRNQDLRIFDAGIKAKSPELTVVGEYAHNTNAQHARYHNHAAQKGWYVELYTGPTSDMTSGLPLQKPGTSVWSLKYQDLGQQGQYVHNATFFDDHKGWRLNYGHTFRKGLSADIAFFRGKDKGTNSDGRDRNKGKYSNVVVAELCYKFR